MDQTCVWDRDWFLNRAQSILDNNRELIKGLEKGKVSAEIVLYNLSEVVACLDAAERRNDADVSTIS